ncbi:hypothetical protein E4U55_000169 [Claviceps digitariae]|nr:hypothetical protein E4U55_000169 [Claviceps digitariae]
MSLSGPSAIAKHRLVKCTCDALRASAFFPPRTTFPLFPISNLHDLIRSSTPAFQLSSRDDNEESPIRNITTQSRLLCPARGTDTCMKVSSEINGPVTTFAKSGNYFHVLVLDDEQLLFALPVFVELVNNDPTSRKVLKTICPSASSPPKAVDTKEQTVLISREEVSHKLSRRAALDTLLMANPVCSSLEWLGAARRLECRGTSAVYQKPKGHEPQAHRNAGSY